VPTFGRDTIRRFSGNVSELKRLAAHNFEDILQVRKPPFKTNDSHAITQCIIPVFDGLLPEPHNQKILELLFVMAHWHGLAKLRLHTDPTLDIMDSVTVSLGTKLRHFAKVICPAYNTRELQREADARNRRQVAKTQKGSGLRGTDVDPRGPSNGTTRREPSGQMGRSIATVTKEASMPGGHRRAKQFNLNTYKNHALGDYTAIIRQIGTTDSYSTEPVSFDWVLNDTY
jgi:hypothetical protein